MPYQQIPLTSGVNQRFQITLDIDGQSQTRELFFSYNEMGNFWEMDIADTLGNSLASAIPLLTPGNVLAPYSYLGLGSAYVVNAANSPLDHPIAATLGVSHCLLWNDTQR